MGYNDELYDKQTPTIIAMPRHKIIFGKGSPDIAIYNDKLHRHHLTYTETGIVSDRETFTRIECDFFLKSTKRMDPKMFEFSEEHHNLGERLEYILNSVKAAVRFALRWADYKNVNSSLAVFEIWRHLQKIRIKQEQISNPAVFHNKKLAESAFGEIVENAKYILEIVKNIPIDAENIDFQKFCTETEEKLNPRIAVTEPAHRKKPFRESTPEKQAKPTNSAAPPVSFTDEYWNRFLSWLRFKNITSSLNKDDYKQFTESCIDLERGIKPVQIFKPGQHPYFLLGTALLAINEQPDLLEKHHLFSLLCRLTNWLRLLNMDDFAEKKDVELFSPEFIQGRHAEMYKMAKKSMEDKPFFKQAMEHWSPSPDCAKPTTIAWELLKRVTLQFATLDELWTSSSAECTPFDACWHIFLLAWTISEITNNFCPFFADDDPINEEPFLWFKIASALIDAIRRPKVSDKFEKFAGLDRFFAFSKAPKDSHHHHHPVEEPELYNFYPFTVLPRPGDLQPHKLPKIFRYTHYVYTRALKCRDSFKHIVKKRLADAEDAFRLNTWILHCENSSNVTFRFLCISQAIT